MIQEIWTGIPTELNLSGVYVITHDISRKFYIGSSRIVREGIRTERDNLWNKVHHCKELQRLYDTDPRFTLAIIGFDPTNVTNLYDVSMAVNEMNRAVLKMYSSNALLLNPVERSETAGEPDHPIQADEQHQRFNAHGRD